MIYQPKLPQVQSHCYLPKNISGYLLESMKYEQRNEELKQLLIFISSCKMYTDLLYTAYCILSNNNFPAR